MANILTIPESGIFFDGNTAGTGIAPILTGDASGVAIQYDGYAGVEINSSATGVNYLDRFSVEGANGRLFGVTDEVTGTVFSVNDAAGLPIIEVESTSSYDKITLGEYGSDLVVLSGQTSAQLTGSQIASESWVASQGYLTSETDDQNLNEVLGEGNTSSYGISVNQITGTALTIDTDTLFVDSTNDRVGIGTTSPKSILELASQNPVINFKDTNAGADLSYRYIQNVDGKFLFAKANDAYNSFTTHMAIDTDGNVGIGITSPNELLHVEDSSSSSGTSIAIQNAFGESPKNIKFRYNDTVETARIEGFGRNNTSQLPYLAFHVNQTTSSSASNDVAERMRIDSSGNVGIGTTSPNQLLEIDGGTENAFIQLTTPNGKYGGIAFGDPQSATAGRIQYYHGDNSFQFDTSGKFTFEGGNVGIGTTTPGSKLVVAGGTDTSYDDGTLKVVGNIALNSANNLNPALNRWALRVRAGGTEGSFDIYDARHSLSRLTINSSGSVGIGTTSPQQKLHVEGNIYLGPNNTNNFIHSGAALGLQSDSHIFIVSDVNDTSGVGGTDIIFGYGSSTNTDSNQDFTESELGTYPRVEVMRIDSSTDRVGIGTTSPADKLDVAGALRLTSNITFDATKAGRIYKSSNLGLAFHGVTGSSNDFAMFTPAGQLMIVNPTGTNNVSLIPIAAGNVGIGTTSPQAKLQVGDGSNDDFVKVYFSDGTNLDIHGYGIEFNRVNSYLRPTTNNNKNLEIGTNSRNWNRISMYSSDDFLFYNATTELVRITQDGKVGIGTTSPATILDLDDGTLSDIRIRGNATTDVRFAGIAFYNTAGSDTVAAVNVDRDGANDAGALTFDTQPAGGGNTERMRITSSGKVLVNGADDNSGKADFAVSGGTVIAFRNSQVQMGGTDMNWNSKIFDDGGARWAAWDRNIEIFSTGSNTGSATARDIIFSPQTSGSAASTERMRIKGDGNVGIGTTSPSHKLEIGLTSTVALANQPAEPLHVSNNGQSVDGRVFISVKHDVVNTASAVGAGFKMTAAAVTSGTASYDDSLIFLESAGPGNDTIHSAPKAIKFYVDNHATNAGSGASYADLGDLALTIAENTNATFAGDATISGDLTVSTDFEAAAAVNFSALANAGSDVDKFLVSDSGDVKFRTGAEVLSDIGGITDVGGKTTKKISGDGSATTFTVTHSFGTPHVMTQLLHYGNNGTGATYEVVQATVKRNSDNAIDVVFGTAPTSSEDYLVLVTKMPAIS